MDTTTAPLEHPHDDSAGAGPRDDAAGVPPPAASDMTVEVAGGTDRAQGGWGEAHWGEGETEAATSGNGGAVDAGVDAWGWGAAPAAADDVAWGQDHPASDGGQEGAAGNDTAGDEAATGPASYDAAAGGGGAAPRPSSRTAAYPAAARPRPAPAADAGADDDDIVERVVFPGESSEAQLRRAMVHAVRRKPQRLMTLAELGLRLAKHPVVGDLWREVSQQTRLRDFAEAAVAAVPGALKLEHNETWKQFALVVHPGALRRLALRRAVAAAYPGHDDASNVRRAAAAALVEVEPLPSGVRHSLLMPMMGQEVIRGAGDSRQRLLEARGETFSLAGVLREQGGGYIVVAPINGNVGAPKAARLDAERLLTDAAAGLLGDLSRVPLPPPVRLVSHAAAHPGAAAAAAPTGGPGEQPVPSLAPRVRELLRAALPEGRPEVRAKRAVALVAAASVADPPFTVRSSPIGILLGDLKLKPPKGQMRALFDDEPTVFRAGPPSPNYVIELVYQPLRDHASRFPDEVATSVRVLLQGQTYNGMQLRAPSGASPAATTGPAYASTTRAPYAAPTTASASTVGGSARPAHPAASAPSPPSPSAPFPAPPAGQPEDYYPRLLRALEERLDVSSASDFINRARRTVTQALLRRGGMGRYGGQPFSMTVKDAAVLLKRALPEAYSDRRPPGMFPINVVVLAQQLPTLLKVDKSPVNARDWVVILNINSLELTAGLNPTPAAALAVAAAGPPSGDGEAYGTDADVNDDEYADWGGAHGTASEDPNGQDSAAADGGGGGTMPAAAVADILATQPAHALAAALAPTIPPDQLPEPDTHVITVPYGAMHVTALAHCMSCPQIGLAAKSVGGVPALVLLYAPAVDSLKPAAAAAANGGGGRASAPSAASVMPATVYVFDAAAAGPSDGGVLLASLRRLLEDPGVAKVVHGCEQLVPGLEQAVGCGISPLLDTRVVSEMLRPLDLSPPPAGGSAEEVPQADEGSAPTLWSLPSNWQAALTTKYWDYQMAALQHASGTDNTWLTRPLDSSQTGLLVRAVQHLPELWSALTWLLPRLAQFCSIARAQQCRALMAQAQAQTPATAPAGSW